MVSKIKTVITETTGLNNEQETAIQSTIADQAMMASYEILRRVGRIEAMDFLSRVTDLAIAKTFTEIKNSKEYKNLPYINKNGKSLHVTTMEEFCQVFLGKSYDRCYRLAQNLNLLGEELYEQAEQIGFTARDYQALKALPSDDQEIVKQAIETEDKEHVIDLLQEMAVKHKREKESLSKEKEELAKKLEDKTASYEQQAQLLAEKSTAINKYKIEIAKAKKHIDAMLPEDIGEELRKEAAQLINEVELAIRGKFYSALSALAEHQEATAIDHSALMSGFVGQLLRSINEVALNLDIKATPDSDPLPDFLRPGAMEEAIAANEQAEQEAKNDL